MSEVEFATHSKHDKALTRGVKGSARSIFRKMALSVLSATNRSVEDKFLRCIYCHCVFDDQKDTFEALMMELKKMGEFVDTDTCVRMLKGEQTIDKRYFHLSFDDGFRNNFTNAFSVLRRLKIPAIFFVPSALIGAPRDKTEQYSLETTRHSAVIEMMKWEELAEMVSAGYEIGSHTRTHARFSEISGDAVVLENEIVGSKKDLEKELHVECKYISWPFGQRTDADALSLRAVQDAGYRACFAAYRGTVVPEVTSIFSIPRHHFEIDWPFSHIKYFARGNMERSRGTAGETAYART